MSTSPKNSKYSRPIFAQKMEDDYDDTNKEVQPADHCCKYVWGIH